MMRRPKNLLYANTDSFVPAPTRKAATRRVRSRVPASTQKIGVIDLSAKAGLLFNVLDRVNRKQNRYTFYPVEAPLPMGLGVISEDIIEQFVGDGNQFDPSEREDLLANVIAEDFFPLLKGTREAVGVDQMVGLVGPMLAWSENGRLRYNYFSLGEEKDILVSAHEMRDFARAAGRTFEAAMAMLVVAQVWGLTFNIAYHDETLGCIFDFCEKRSDLIQAFRRIDIDSECLARIPTNERENVSKCLEAIREYGR